ncbi:MAG: heme exporter protein CcmB, partial [Pseudomonadota bacterium]
PVPLSLIILIKMSVAWVGSCLPLVLISPALFFAFGVENVWQGALGFLLGTPGLAFISGALSALCASLKRGTVMIVFLAIPLFAPAFVFGPATLSDSPLVPFLIMAIFSLQALALCPFIAAAAIRTHMS